MDRKTSPFGALTSLVLVAVLCVLPFYGCANLHAPLQLRALRISAPEHVHVTVVCNGYPTYTLELEPGRHVDVGGPDMLCVFEADSGKALDIEAVWHGDEPR